MDDDREFCFFLEEIRAMNRRPDFKPVRSHAQSALFISGGSLLLLVLPLAVKCSQH